MPNRVVDQTDITESREALCEGLIGFLGFSVGGVSAGADHGREGLRSVFGEVEIGRDDETGAALVGKYLNIVSLAFDGPDDFGVERRLLFWEGGKARVNPFTNISDVSFRVSLGFKCCFAGCASTFGANDLLEVVIVHHPRKAIERLKFAGGGLFCES